MKRYAHQAWVPFGWHGITLTVPAEWNLGKITGDDRTGKSGYVRLDDAEIARVEVEWRSSKPGEPSMEKFVDRYLAVLEKKAKQQRTPFRVRRDVSRRDALAPVEAVLEGADGEIFVWEADYRAYNLVRRCPTCGRIALVRVLSKMDENLSSVAGQVMASLEDHALGGRVRWGVYGFVFTVPEGFTLEEYALKSGHLALTFEYRGSGVGAGLKPAPTGLGSGPRPQTLKIECVSLANLLLKETPLPAWFEGFYFKALRDVNLTFADAEEHGHPGLRVKGSPKSRWRMLLRPLPFIGHRPRLYLDGRIWPCPASNKILVVQAWGKERDRLSPEVVDVVCHPIQEASGPPQPRGDAAVVPPAQRTAEVGDER